jgi:PhnB protein
MTVQPYLFFNGRAEEALDFYKQALDAKPVMLMRFKENPGGEKVNPPGSSEKVMHMAFNVGDTMVLASDGMKYDGTNFQGFALAITVDSVEKAKKMEAALKQGGSQGMPPGETFFAKYFAMVTDKFGVQWMLLAEPKQ